ncbi:hypothetical protein TNCV_3704701 [Trichonephila clavipes]|nr:hypothetical protein TNCV_3704701 [Trichonephila clavipes]
MTHVLPLVGHVRFAWKFKNLYRWRGHRGERKDGEKEEGSQQVGSQQHGGGRSKMAKGWMDSDFANLDESNAK